MSGRRYVIGLLSLFFLSTIWIHTMLASPNTATQYYLDRIKMIQDKSDAEAVRKLIADIETKWGAKKDADYYRVVLELCLALNSSTTLDPNRANIARKLATAALDASGDKPVDSEVKLILFLQSDPEYTQGTLRGVDWEKGRLLRVCRWLTICQHLQAAKNNLPAVSGPIQVSVWPPPGEGVNIAGIAPSRIKDPVRRKKYEEAIAQNAEKARIYRRKRDLKDLEDLFIGPAKRYIMNAYSKPPFQTDELEKTLEGSSLDANCRTEIVSEVKKRIAAHMEQEAKQPPPPRMQITEPPLPADAPTHHADPRLRVRVSFDLASPRVDDVLHELRQATKVSLSRGDEIQNRYPAHGSLSFRGVPAWQVMDVLSESKRVQGRWEKDGAGYRLVRNENPLDIPEDTKDRPGKSSPHRRMFLLISSGVFTGLLLVLLAFRWRYHRQEKQDPTA